MVAVYGTSTTYEAVTVPVMDNSGNFVTNSIASRSGMSGTISNGDIFTVTIPASDDMNIHKFLYFNNTSNDISNMAEYFDLRVQYFGNGGYIDQDGSLSGQGEQPGDANTVLNLDVVCFTKGTLIKTADGQVPVEDLKVGSLVWTVDHGLLLIRWISSNTVAVTEKTRPVLIKKDAMGNGFPEIDLRVSQQHRVLVNGPVTETLLGLEEVLVAAKHIVGTDGIALDEDCETVTYAHFMFEKHEIVQANGALCESFFPGPSAIESLDRACLDELLEIFPDLAEAGFAPCPARVFLNGDLGKKLSHKHIKKDSHLFFPKVEHFDAQKSVETVKAYV